MTNVKGSDKNFNRELLLLEGAFDETAASRSCGYLFLVHCCNVSGVHAAFAYCIKTRSRHRKI
jgi:hypothetical protein